MNLFLCIGLATTVVLGGAALISWYIKDRKSKIGNPLDVAENLKAEIVEEVKVDAAVAVEAEDLKVEIAVEEVKVEFVLPIPAQEPKEPWMVRRMRLKAEEAAAALKRKAEEDKKKAAEWVQDAIPEVEELDWVIPKRVEQPSKEEQEVERIRIRQERERQLYENVVVYRKAQIAEEQMLAGGRNEYQPDSETILDTKTRSILFKLKNVDHFPLDIQRCVSSDDSNSVYHAIGENEFHFAFKVNHDGKSAKDEFKKLDEMEKSGLGKCPSPVLYRGHVLVTKWMDKYSFESVAVDTQTPDLKPKTKRRDLSKDEKKAQKKSIKLAQAKNRENALLGTDHNSGISQRQVIRKRLYIKGQKPAETTEQP